MHILGVSGSREFGDSSLVHKLLALEIRKHRNPIIASGFARGVDSIARAYAVTCGLFIIDIPVVRQHWEIHGKKAANMRNPLLAKISDSLLAIALLDPDTGEATSGTANTIREFYSLGKPHIVHEFEDHGTAFTDSGMTCDYRYIRSLIDGETCHISIR